MRTGLPDDARYRATARRRMRTYARRSGLDYRPRVVFSMKDWLAIGGSPDDAAFDEGRVAGLSNPDIRAVYFELPSNLCEHELDLTAAHEGVHLRWPGLAHGELFDRRTEALRAGVAFGPRGARLPVMP